MNDLNVFPFRNKHKPFSLQCKKAASVLPGWNFVEKKAKINSDILFQFTFLVLYSRLTVCFPLRSKVIWVFYVLNSPWSVSDRLQSLEHTSRFCILAELHSDAVVHLASAGGLAEFNTECPSWHNPMFWRHTETQISSSMKVLPKNQTGYWTSVSCVTELGELHSRTASKLEGRDLHVLYWFEMFDIFFLVLLLSICIYTSVCPKH